VFPQNFTEFHVNTEILQQRLNSVSLDCCCNCKTQSLRTATQACWFQWRVFTFSLLTNLSFYLLDLCRWRWPVISTIDWWVMTYLVTLFQFTSDITGPKSAQCTLKWAATVSCGIPGLCREIWQSLPRKTVGPIYQFLVVVCSNNVSTLQDITTFSVYMTACDLQKSFSLNETVKIISNVLIIIHV